MATMACISHKRLNPNDSVVFLTTDEHLCDSYVSALSKEMVDIQYYPNVRSELDYICADGDLFRLHTFARWQCYLNATTYYKNEVHALLDPDIISTERWSDIEKRLAPGTIAFTRQIDWDYFINGGFIVGYKCDMEKVATFLMQKIRKDILAGSYIKLPYDQIYWNRYFNTMKLSSICVGNDFIQLAIEEQQYMAKLIHQIDHKGTLFRYPVMMHIAQDYNFAISEEELSRY